MKAVLLKMDGDYEEIDAHKVEYFSSKGYIVKTWKEMFSESTELSARKIKELESKFEAERNDVLFMDDKLNIATEALAKIKSASGTSSLQWKLADEAIQNMHAR